MSKKTKTTAASKKTQKQEAKIINITSKEKLVLDNLIDGLYAEPGFSDIDCNDLAKSCKIPVSSIKGVVGSLFKKGLVYTQQTNTFGAPKCELVYLQSLAYCLHPQWKDEAEELIELKVSDEKLKKDSTSSDKKETLSSKLTKAEDKIEKQIKGSKSKAEGGEKIEESKTNKPYSVYGIHGKNIDSKEFKKGDSVEFKIKGKTVKGTFIHLHINNWSPKGYAVIKHEGKIYERVLKSISKVEQNAAPRATKKASEKTSKNKVK